MEFNDLLNYARNIAKRVNEVIFEIVKGEPRVLYDAALHLIKAGGKRLRPLLLVLSGRLYGLNEDIGIRASASVEILHNFTLIHDDIMDHDTTRRGVPTVHVLWGEDIAILAGDLLFSLSYKALTNLVKYGIDPDRVVRAIDTLTWAAKTVDEGQALDMELSKRSNASLEDYINMVYKKTAALFEASSAIGAILAGAPNEEVEKVRMYALSIGIAFQIRDDELGLIADEKKLGKPKYSDLREGKRTILVIHALNNLSEDKRSKLLSILGKRDASRSELEYATKLIIDSGALEFSNKLAQEYLERGIRALNSTSYKDLKAKELLLKLAYFFARRQY